MSQKLKCAWYFLGATPQKRGVGLIATRFFGLAQAAPQKELKQRLNPSRRPGNTKANTF
jgi:hypothetical protein